MNKATLIELMAKETKLPKTACKDALESIIKAIEQSLKKNKSVVLTGFGTFSV
ncbi:HU family DNA-binding protein, partial [Candidatus Babeliales bacterium]|nr:HU family DNA-binding protein [Candidatus Babeliales bacterium]